ncbi:MAG: ADP-forming succinate--CoA ligase subunit beta [Phycisphaeraceae bacterium]|jgi:succinyl-CoA synthetase beta subunit|nr:ADP-forming succinate--CoA ligase subunit beta [Phycisphaeraceae bacterium]
MKAHEYQARELLAKFGIPVPDAIVVESSDAAAAAFDQLSAPLAVVKAQVHAGGRGKGGGVKLVRSADEAREVAQDILSKPLVTPQTGPQGVPVRQLLVATGVDIKNEFYLGLAVDRAGRRPVLIASAQGGVDIETIAKENPDAILREPIDPDAGLRSYQARKVAFGLGFTGKQVSQVCGIMASLCRLMLDTDASLAEINPLVLTPADDDHPDGRVLAIDAKINFDDNALFRHKDIAQLEDKQEVDAHERRAQKYGLSYIKLDGRIGCLVNGAGLAMATMDMIKLHGAEPANFLDVGGSASEEAVTEAFRIILSDDKVEGVLVNIFGGIAKCDTIARAIIRAADLVGFTVPLVVRLEGTNVDVARGLLEDAKSQLPTLRTAADLTEAAELITGAVTV